MIKVVSGKDNIVLAAIAEQHWYNLNPRYASRKGDYQRTGALAGRFTVHQEKKITEGKTDEAAFFQKFCDYDFALLKACIVSPASSFKTIINHVEELLTEHHLQVGAGRTTAMSELLALFNYENWRTNGGGYKHFLNLESKVCTYCNLEDLKNDEVKMLFIGTYDHYYDKAIYPYLSMAVGNLIPSCYPCNQTYKKTLFCTVSHVHPHIDDYDDLCTIATDYAGDLDVNFKIWMIPNYQPDDRRLRVDAELHLGTRYNDEAVRKQVVVIRSVTDLHPPERITDISFEMGLSSEDAIRYICNQFDLPYKPEEISNTVYGKLKRDIAVKGMLESV